MNTMEINPKKAEIEVPEAYLCPITYKPMKDPVATLTGQVYERKAIETWFKNHDTDPLTNDKLVAKTLIPLYELKNTIQKFLLEHQEDELILFQKVLYSCLEINKIISILHPLFSDNNSIRQENEQKNSPAKTGFTFVGATTKIIAHPFSDSLVEIKFQAEDKTQLEKIFNLAAEALKKVDKALQLTDKLPKVTFMTLPEKSDAIDVKVKQELPPFFTIAL